MVKKYADLYMEAHRALLMTEDQQTANLYARNLLCKASNLPYEKLLADRDLYASEDTCNAMEEYVKRVLRGEPIAYVLGEWDFY